VLGLGASVVYPLTLSVAARPDDRPVSGNVVAATMVAAVACSARPHCSAIWPKLGDSGHLCGDRAGSAPVPFAVAIARPDERWKPAL